MKTKKNSSAFKLIKTMSMSEKRYFKIFSDRHTIGTQNKYLTLFKILDKRSIEDDPIIKRELKKANINAEFLAADKNYLYNQILGSLNNFHNSKTLNIEIKSALLSVEILFYKGLYNECLKLISRTEPLAEECENFQLMIDLLMWEKKCCGYSIGLTRAAEINSSINKYILLLNNLKTITNLYYKSYFLQTNYEKNSRKEVRDKFRYILAQPELKSENNALSFCAKIFFFLIYSNYYYSLDNKEKEYDYLQKLINMLNASKTYAIENPLDYISIYNRLLAIKKYNPSSDFFNDIKILKEFPGKIQIHKEEVIQRIFFYTGTNELEYYLINDEFQKGLLKMNEIEKNISKLNLNIEPYYLIYFYYLQITVLIFEGQYHKALKITNYTLNNFNLDDRPQVFIRAMILNVAIHAELQNYGLVLNSINEISRLNSGRKLLVKAEEELLNGFYKIAKNNIYAKKEIKNIYMGVLQIMEKSKDKNMDLINNYLKWLKIKTGV